MKGMRERIELGMEVTWASWELASGESEWYGRDVWWHLHALLLCVLGTVRAIKELSLEKLNGDNSKDEHEELVDDEDVEDVFQ